MKRLSILLFFLSVAAQATTILVPEEFETIQEAIDSSEESDTVLISPGQYYENLIPDHSLSFFGTSTSSWPADSALTWDTQIIGSTDTTSGRCLYISPQINGDFVFRGLHFLDGVAESESGGALYSRNSNVSIIGCVFSENSAYVFGACYLGYGEFLLEDNRFLNNQATLGGAATLDHGSVTVCRNRFEGNSASQAEAGALRVYTSSGFIEDNSFISNESYSLGGGLLLIGDGSWIVRNNLFKGNESGEGAALTVFEVDTVLIQGNNFFDNIAVYTGQRPGMGGAVSLNSGCASVNIQNNVFENNTADINGGAMVLSNNCSVRHNLILENFARNGSAIYSQEINNSNPSILAEFNLFFENAPTPNSSKHYRGAVSAQRNTEIRLTSNDFISQQSFAAGLREVRYGDITCVGNFWGHSSGPYHPVENPAGLGDTVHTSVSILPFSETSFVVMQLQVEPGEVSFGEVPLDSIAQQVLQLRNSGYFPVVVSDIQSAGQQPEFTWDFGDSLIIEGNSSQELTLYFQPLEEGLRNDTLVISSNDPLHPQVLVPLHGEGVLLSVVHEQDEPYIPSEFRMMPAAPNPFNNSTVISVSLPEATSLDVDIYTMTGRFVASIASGDYQSGLHRLVFDGSGLPSGSYFIRASAGQWQETQRIELLK